MKSVYFSSQNTSFKLYEISFYKPLRFWLIVSCTIKNGKMSRSQFWTWHTSHKVTSPCFGKRHPNNVWAVSCRMTEKCTLIAKWIFPWFFFGFMYMLFKHFFLKLAHLAKSNFFKLFNKISIVFLTYKNFRY